MDDPETRIGDAERAGAMEALAEHMRAGRLDPHEYDERVEAATAARTRSQLDPLFADLPAPHPPRPDEPARTAPMPRSPDAAPEPGQGPLFGRAGTTLVAASPFLAVLLFFLTGYEWWWFLLVPLSGVIVYGPGGRSQDARRRDARREARDRRRDR